MVYGAIFATRMTSDNKDHMGRNDRKASHYNLKDRKNLSTKPNNSKAWIFLVNLEVLGNHFIIHGSDELIP